MSFSQRRPRITLTRLNQRPLRDVCFAMSMRIERVRRQGNFAWRRRPGTLFCRRNENISAPGTQIQPKQDATCDDEKYGQKVEQQRQRSLHLGQLGLRLPAPQASRHVNWHAGVPPLSPMSLAPPRAKRISGIFVRHPKRLLQHYLPLTEVIRSSSPRASLAPMVIQATRLAAILPHIARGLRHADKGPPHL